MAIEIVNMKLLTADMSVNSKLAAAYFGCHCLCGVTPILMVLPVYLVLQYDFKC